VRPGSAVSAPCTSSVPSPPSSPAGAHPPALDSGALPILLAGLAPAAVLIAPDHAHAVAAARVQRAGPAGLTACARPAVLGRGRATVTMRRRRAAPELAAATRARAVIRLRRDAIGVALVRALPGVGALALPLAEGVGLLGSHAGEALPRKVHEAHQAALAIVPCRAVEGARFAGAFTTGGEPEREHRNDRPGRHPPTIARRICSSADFPFLERVFAIGRNST
jgi:hypothetical protein